MRNRVTIYDQEISNNERTNSFLRSNISRSNSSEQYSVSDILVGEGSESFNNYLKWLGLDKDPEKVVLSSMHHYYYDEEELKNVKIVINLKALNYVKEIKNFIYSISNILSDKSNLIGCFIDNKKQNGFALRNDFSDNHSKINADAIENGIISKIPFLNMLYSLLDSRTNQYFSKLSVTILLEDYGFKVLDMKELNGLTFFCAQRLNSKNN
jgi:hypothetical protein